MSWALAGDAATCDRIAHLCRSYPSLDLSSAREGEPLLLQVVADRLCLSVTDEPGWEPIVVDFVGGAMAHRQRGHIGAEYVVKAVQGRSKDTLDVVDATAGLGRDAFLLALAGHRVLACERHPVVAALLADGLWRATQHAVVADVAHRVRLHPGSAFEVLPKTACDVVCVDPMFPARDKSALVKKEMRAFKRLVGPDEDGAALLALAQAQARLRVVVKRPSRAPALGGRPSHSIEGKTGRFDVYASARQAADLPSGSAGNS